MRLRKFIAQLADLSVEQPIEPELKTTANKDRDKSIKCVHCSLPGLGAEVGPTWLTACTLLLPREQQDLKAGAVLQAVTQQGEGSSTPNEGDLVSSAAAAPAQAAFARLCCAVRFPSSSWSLMPRRLQVYVHYSVLNEDGDVLYSTWAEEGGSGQPLAFVLGKGCRAPRAWELAVAGATRAAATTQTSVSND
jgi:hypothetical protein